ncbi:MAG: P-II family nitrogen regulator [FCB group bacterium]|nr:P-II family nitrogen regulator [FCB group bacterium]
MKEIKAYIRCTKVDEVILALKAIGIHDMTVIDVMALGRGMIDQDHYKYSIECIDRYSTVSKLEIIAADKKADKIVKTIRKSAYSGEPGDGLILVSPVEFAMKIRSGKVDERILQ